MTLGRQVLLEPIEWDDDGWPRAVGGDLSEPLPTPIPAGSLRGDQEHGIALSDDFSNVRLGIPWSFHAPAVGEQQRISLDDGLVLQASGTNPSDSSPLTSTAGDRRYEISVSMELFDGAQGGLLLYYSDRLYCGMGHDGAAMASYRAGRAIPYWREPAPAAQTIHLKIENDNNIVTMHYSSDGVEWTRHGLRFNVAGYNTNTLDELSSLRPALFATGSGQVKFRNYTYRSLDNIQSSKKV
ncbi:hypothetical protein [Paenarthrobacter ilicis]|uniref:hypothetical protein n=1 Tax=Paenarthrobacter ilicis TaxID=43665 RepID=UPI0028D2BC01|nr:hypothetical protein [Paenarthrobacter ilicis]